MSDAWVVIDLGFGDAGKGAVTDWLVRSRDVPLVVRHHGGAQAGHNVVTPDGRHHTFSQFCAGTFAGAEGLLGPQFLLHPGAMEVEAAHLAPRIGGDPFARTWVAGVARVITPYQQAAGRLWERLRGEGAHGTCGVGVGGCVGDALSYPGEVVRAEDLADRARVRAILVAQRERHHEALRAAGAEELGVFRDDDVLERTLASWARIAPRLRLVDDGEARALVARAPRVVFEGAQGVLLDEVWGFHPHTTWSDCTAGAADALLGGRPATRLGVVRSYATRHGPGPFPTEGARDVHEPHNDDHGWQGRFRVGALDGVLLRYAVEVVGGVDGIVVTHLDQRARGPVVDAYAGGHRTLDKGSPDDLEHRAALGRWLRGVTPVVQVDGVVPFVERAVGCPVVLRGYGPRAIDYR
jgi:adenylosuccinate synthase